jgi:hypothetical protein
MEIPGKVMLYCPLVEAKGTPANLIALNPQGYYILEVTFKGQVHTMFVPIGHAALIFADPEPPREEGFEIER